MEQLPDRPVLEEMAAKASKAGKFGKPIEDLDEVEMMAALWDLLSRERDRRAADLTPVLVALERTVRDIEANGFMVTINRSTENDEAKFTAVVDIPASPGTD